MSDPRYAKAAQVLVNYSIAAKAGDKVWVRATGLPALTLARQVYIELIRIGAHPYLDITDESIAPAFYTLAHKTHLHEPAVIEEFIVNWADKVITLVGEENTTALAAIEPEKIVARQQTKKAVRSAILTKPWVLTWVPSHATAQQAGMSLDDFEDFYFEAVIRDWSTEGKAYARLATTLSQGKAVSITGAETSLTLSTAGRTWIPDKGECNMPGGEVFTAPVETSVEGHVYFEYPVLRSGKLIRDIRLTFSAGRVTTATASENEEFLHHLLGQDEGARRLGELAIGLNPGIKRFFTNTLFDEKMAGTIHMALGEAYEECGGVNTSHLHMDMVKEMRTPGSRVTIDGKVVLNDGVLVR